MKQKNEVGNKYNFLTIIKFEFNKNKHNYFLCKCDCGNQKIMNINNVKSGKSKSCGCYNISMLNNRSKTKLNKYKLYENYGIGYANNTKNKFYFDREDYEKIKNYCWYEDIYGYIVNIYKRKNLKLHKLITNTSKNEIIDHIDRNKLNNRKNNLRVCTTQQNNFNTKLAKNNTSGFKGVGWDKSKNKWCANIGYNYKKIHLGYFVKKEEAINSRINAEKRLYKEYCDYYKKNYAREGEK